jgi:MFS family permease
MFVTGTGALFGFSAITLLPAWSVDILGGDAATNGMLQSARGIGALTAALTLAALGRIQFKGRLFTAGSLLYPVVFLFFSITRSVPLAVVSMMLSGLGLIAVMNLANILIQTHVPENLRGRVMSIYTLTFFGLMPVGSLLAGSLANWLGEPATVRLGALAALTAALLVVWREPQIRRAA